VSLVATIAGPVQGQTRSFADLKGFDDWVTGIMDEWHVPGAAVGAVKDGQIVIARGYGLRDVEAKEPVTSRTVMAIGSNTKSFTAVLMAMLVDDRKLGWDIPVRSYLPDFELFDDYATREMTPRDLVTHRSGLPRHDNVWYGRPFTREQLYQRLRYLEPSASFRSRYQYQNLMFMTAGYLTERITGRSWDALIRDRIFDPLSMSRSNTTVRETPQSGDFASPYTWRNDSLIRLPFRNIDAVGPAGSINSTVDDMLKYIQFRIDQGRVGDRRLLSPESEVQLQSPQMVSAGGAEYPELGHPTYGLGLGVSTYPGRKVVSHGGGIDGFISSMAWLPAERIGVMVLTNLSGNNPVPGLVQRNLLDRLLDLTPVDWVARQRRADSAGGARLAAERTRLERERQPGTQPSHSLGAYAGSYHHPGYGTLVITVDGATLSLTLDPHRARLHHHHYDVWRIEDPGGAVPFGGLLHFLANEKGEVDRVAAPLEPNLTVPVPGTSERAVKPIMFVKGDT
jgi:CubicO group peptidase (beta-lactamase class C family)